MITLHLPYPPSVNQYHRHIVLRGQPRTLVSERGRKYQQAVAGAVRAQIARGAYCAGQRLRVDVVTHAPTKRAFDLDNLGKSLLDALTKAGVWNDDAQIDSLHFERGDVFKGGKVTVYVREDTAASVPLESPAAPVAVPAGHISAEQLRSTSISGKRKGGRG